LTLRIDTERYKILRGLLSDPGFEDMESVISFALAVGIFFNGSSDTAGDPEVEFDVTEMEIWPMIQLVMHNSHPELEDITRMNRVLEGYLLGGIDMISEKVVGKKGIDAMEALIPLMPP
jgi:hypothetical protein